MSRGRPMDRIGGRGKAAKPKKISGNRTSGVWLDEPQIVPEPNDQLNPPMGSGPDRDESRIEAAVVSAMDRAARVGLGQRGRIRAGQRAMAKEQRRIEKERGR